MAVIPFVYVDTGNELYRVSSKMIVQKRAEAIANEHFSPGATGWDQRRKREVRKAMNDEFRLTEFIEGIQESTLKMYGTRIERHAEIDARENEYLGYPLIRTDSA